MPTLPSSIDVLVVGAGPTGLALAGELTRRGVDVLVVDKAAAGSDTSRAAVIHARTLEVLEPLGVVPQLTEEGLRIRFMRARKGEETLLSIDFTGIPSRYNYALAYPQSRTEAVLMARLLALGGAVVRPAEVTAVTRTVDGLSAGVRVADTTQTVAARWVVGCDGMHSRVREAAGIGFAGATYELGFALADVRMDWPLSRDEFSLYLADEGLLFVAPLPDDHFRIIAMAEDAPEQPSAAYIQALLDSRGAKGAKVREAVWSSRFHVHHRLAETPRKGRVLLCGDAAHVHSPAGGQGMNTGIQDAVSLAGTLAEVLGGAPETRLDDWASKRHAIAESVVATTDRMTRMATASSPIGRLARIAMIGLVGRVPALQDHLARRISEIDNR